MRCLNQRQKKNHERQSKTIIKDNQNSIKNSHKKQSSKTIKTKSNTIIKSNQSKTSDLLVSFDTTYWAC